MTVSNTFKAFQQDFGQIISRAILVHLHNIYFQADCSLNKLGDHQYI